MASTPGNGSLLKVTISSTPTTVGQQFRFTGPKQTRPKIDFTILSSSVRTYIAGLKNSDEVEFEAYSDPSDASHAYLVTSYGSAVTEAWTVAYADAGTATLTFSGFLTSLEYGEVALDNLVVLRGTICLTTAVTVTP